MGKTRKRKKPSFKEEIKVWRKGFDFVIGVDEVGRGAFAGPVTVGAVVFDKDTPYRNPRPELGPKVSILAEINDSKLLSSRKRETLSPEIKKHALYWSTASTSVSIINKIGIGKATQMAFRKAISKIIQSIRHSGNPPAGGASRISIDNKRFWTSQNDGAFLLVDGFHIRYVKAIGLKNQKAIIKGDQKSISIAAASTIAKVHRDNLMRKIHKKFPSYNFTRNKGYGTKEHRDAIKKYGLSNMHRKSFNLSKFLN